MKIHNNDVRLPFKFSQYLVNGNERANPAGAKTGLRR